MGLDGGTIATRTDLLRRSSWRLSNHDGGGQRSTRGGQLTVDGALSSAGVERHSTVAAAREAFSQCALSGARFNPATAEIVACALGQLYLRSSVVEFLAKHGQFAPGMCDPAPLEAACGHIERLRDVFPVSLTPSGDDGAATGMWRCPIDGVTTNGQHSFCCLRPCGHVVRERVALEIARSGAAAETSSSSAGPASDGISTIEGARWACPSCSTPVEVRVRLLPAAEEVRKVRDTLRAAADERRARKAERKERKRARDDESGGAGGAAAASSSSAAT